MSAAVDWSKYEFIGDDAGGGKYANKYKVETVEGLNVVNIQKPGFATEDGIYMTVPAGITSCSVASAIQGAGVVVYLSALTALENEVTIKYDTSKEIIFHIYYADGGGAKKDNVVLNEMAYASSGTAVLGNDGNKGTRWASDVSDNEWWLCKMAEESEFNTVQILWEGAYAKSFKLEVSNDSTAWTEIANIQDQTLQGFPHLQTITVGDQKAKYLRFVGVERGTGYGYSFWELRAFVKKTPVLTTIELKAEAEIVKVGEGLKLTTATKDQDDEDIDAEVNYTILPIGAGKVENGFFYAYRFGSATITATSGSVSSKPVSVFCYLGENVALSTNIDSNNKVIAQSEFTPKGTNAFYAVDGNDGSVWQGSATDGTADTEEARTFDSWFILDLGNEYDINLVSIKFEGACAQEYHLDFSVDNVDWKVAYNYVGNAGINAHTDLLYGDKLANATAVRYVRFFSTKAATQWGMKMFEMRVFGTERSSIVPKMLSAKVLSIDEKTRNVTLLLDAERTDNGITSKIHNFHLLDSKGNIWRTVSTDENGKVELNDINPCEKYNVGVIAAGYQKCDTLYVEFETPAGNMAYKRTATAGYSQGNYTPNLAVDGVVNDESRWSGYGASVADAWWKVDLADIRSIDSIRINYESNEIDGFEIATSLDDKSWSPLVVSSVYPVLGWDVYKTNAIGRYMRIKPNAVRGQGWSIREFEVYGDCTYDDKPRMIFASLESVATSTAEVRVSATDAVTPFAELEYECILTQGENVYRFTILAEDGILHLEKMRACAGHTLEVWAINKAGKKSDNSAMVRFTTECDLVDLWLAGSMNALPDGQWNYRDDNYRFHKTNVNGIYSLTCRLPKGDNTYKLSNGSNTSVTTDNHHLVFDEETEVTFYARGVNNFASSADSIFVVGTAVGGWSPSADGKYCDWVGELAIWSGDITQAGLYKIVKIAHSKDCNNTEGCVCWNDLWEANQTISGVSENSTKASFIFDLPTLSWNWQEVYEGQCTFSGTKGDGQSHDGGTTLFTKGYNISLYLNSRKDTIFVKVEFLDDDKTATSALFQNYPQRDEKLEVKEWRFNREGETQVFSGKVPISELSNKADGIIRFGIKFEFAGGLRVTTPKFYYLDGSGCAERDFVIYHHAQTPADAERDAVESFAGGRILQPIQYKRKLRPDVWETLSIPFEVNQVTVTDEDGEYEIYPQYDNNGVVTEGEFWLRDFREKEVSAEDFQANWHDIQAASAKAALPKKNVPYIIRVPDDDTHYWADKYIVFHGEGYQTIDDVYSTDVQTPRAIEMFAYSGNNTMKEWLLRSAYVLDDAGEYFRSGETVTLYPFECAVNAEQATIAKMPRLSLNKRPGTATDSKIPTTAMEAGSVWTLMGGYVGAFGNVDEYDALLQRLPEGVYIVSRGEQADKLYLIK